MRIITEIKNIKEKIIQLLTDHVHLRDDDNKLIANIWYCQLGDRNIKASVFLQKLADGQLVNSESIRRCRQKVQEQNPELRGAKYGDRIKDGKKSSTEFHSV